MSESSFSLLNEIINDLTSSPESITVDLHPKDYARLENVAKKVGNTLPVVAHAFILSFLRFLEEEESPSIAATAEPRIELEIDVPTEEVEEDNSVEEIDELEEDNEDELSDDDDSEEGDEFEFSNDADMPLPRDPVIEEI